MAVAESYHEKETHGMKKVKKKKRKESGHYVIAVDEVIESDINKPLTKEKIGCADIPTNQNINKRCSLEEDIEIMKKNSVYLDCDEPHFSMKKKKKRNKNDMATIKLESMKQDATAANVDEVIILESEDI